MRNLTLPPSVCPVLPVKTPPPILATILSGCALLAAGTVGLAGAGVDGLEQASPFSPAPVATADGGVLEFRGILSTGSGVILGFTDRDSGQSFWVPAGSDANATGPVVVRSFDSVHDQARVEYRGRPLLLTLIEVKIAVAEPLPAPASIDPTKTGATPLDPATKQTVDELMQRRAQRQSLNPDPGVMAGRPDAGVVPEIPAPAVEAAPPAGG